MAIATRLTLEEFTAIPGFDERRLELIDGELVEKPLPTWEHGRAAGELYVATRAYGSGAVEPRAMIPETARGEASSPDVTRRFLQTTLAALADEELLSSPTK